MGIELNELQQKIGAELKSMRLLARRIHKITSWAILLAGVLMMILKVSSFLEAIFKSCATISSPKNAWPTTGKWICLQRAWSTKPPPNNYNFRFFFGYNLV